jgi:hypothetical protein
MKAIELKLPGTNPTTIFVDALQSIVFEQAEGNHGDRVVIEIDGWETPYTYEGEDASAVYHKLIGMFVVVPFHWV